MTDPREQLEWLISRQGDGDLTAGERAEIQRAIERDPAVATELKRFEKLDGLLATWRSTPVDFDWASFRGRVSEAIEHSQVDEALKSAMGPLPEVDWDRFRSRVSNAVRAEAQLAAARTGGVHRLRSAAGWAVPLAAAAAIAIAFFRTGGGPLPVTPPGGDDRPSIVVVSLDIPESRGRVAISFDETPAPAPQEDTAHGSAYVISAPAGGFPMMEDDAQYY